MYSETDLPDKTSVSGTPRDYTEDMYRCYFEVGEHLGRAKEIISNFIGQEKAQKLLPLAYGYEVEMPIQAVPDLVRLLANSNIAVYQVVRYAKTNSVWRD